MRFARPLAIACVLAPACSSTPPAPPPPPECLPGVDGTVAPPPIHTPRWAFEPWLGKDYSSTDDTLAFIQGSIDRNIPVGVALIDSPWETNYNTFVPDESPSRYHDFAATVSTLANEGVRTVLWITPFVNDVSYDLEIGATTHYDGPAPGFDLATECGFFVDDGHAYPWYKGSGGAIDFFDPSALAWWHAQQDAVLATGIAGYKVDFGDAYVTTDPVMTAAGPEPHQAYSEAYYRDLLAYGASKRPPGDFATMVRGWDVSYGFAPRTYARPEDAPIVWAGDNRRDWVGLADALNTSFMSASLGYVVVGSDVGGYLDHDDQDLTGPQIPFDTLVFARWTAMSALMPLMQLLGRGDVMPWSVPDDVDETVTLYRYWATLHHELAPFYYSLAEGTYAGRAGGIVRPVGAAGDFRYMLGDAFLVAPILDASGVRDVVLPAGAKYYDWWTPAAAPLDGGTTLAQYDATDRSRIPLFVREGAIVPLAVSTDVVPVGDASSAGALTVLVYPSATPSSFTFYDDDDTTTTLTQSIAAGAITVGLSRTVKPALVRVRLDAASTAATVDGAPATAAPDFDTLAASPVAASFVEPSTSSIWIKVPAAQSQQTIVVTP
ncbi:MAG TPA: TIM-barrel domain-containing protein [Polyangiaceae bacterium]|jgi:alpha-glucosidase (family GH31 glycosyl hydrolase)